MKKSVIEFSKHLCQVAHEEWQDLQMGGEGEVGRGSRRRGRRGGGVGGGGEEGGREEEKEHTFPYTPSMQAQHCTLSHLLQGFLCV